MAKPTRPEYTMADRVRVSDLRDWHEVRVTCSACGRHASLFRTHLTKRFTPETAFQEVAARLKCSACGAVGQAKWSVYRMKRY